MIINYLDYHNLGLDPKIFKSDLFSSAIGGASRILFAEKSWTLLSFLFGYGFAELMNNISEKGINQNVFFIKRMTWLFIFALINSALFWGDFLKDYAVMGLVLLLSRQVSTKVIGYISLILIFAIPAIAAFILSLQSGMAWVKVYSPLLESHNLLDVLRFGLIGTYQSQIVQLGHVITVHTVMLTCFLLGLLAQRIQFFNRVSENIKMIKGIFWLSLCSILIVIFLAIVSSQFKLAWVKYYRPYYLMILASMTFIVSTICWLYVRNRRSRFFFNLQFIGRMTLTNYIVQNIIALIMFSGIGFGLSLTHRMHASYYLLTAIIVFVLQIYFSKWWLRHYKYGPIEWVWRQLSYGKRIPLRNGF